MTINRFKFAVCRSLVARGAGLAIVDAINGDDALGGGIVSRAFEPTIRYDLALVYAARRGPSALTRSFIESLRSTLA